MNDNKLYTNPDLTEDSIYDKLHKYIISRYEIAFNTISLEHLIKFNKSNKWNILNANSLLIELTKKNSKIKKNQLETYLGSNYIKEINPFKDYFQGLDKWDKIDHIKNLASYLDTDNNELFEYHFKKWLVRTVKCATNDNYFNKNCLVLAQEEENSGKTTFCRFLCPPKLKKYIAENIGPDKDGQTQLCKNFIINLDEIDKIDKRSMNAYKSYFSKTHINIRLPYAKNFSQLPRTTSFLGSTNLLGFLKDKTGNVRWLVFELLKINFDYSNDIDIDKVWMQAYHLAYSSNYNSALTREDVIENEKRNEKYKSFSFEEDLINQLFEKSNNKDDFMTATQITNIIKKDNQYVSHIMIGKELVRLGFKRFNSPKTGNKGYMIKIK